MLEWLSNTPYAMWVKQDIGWPIALTFHAFGNGIVVGLIFIIALRLLGLFPKFPIPQLRKFFPIIWGAIVVQVISGSTLLLTKPIRYLGDGMFQWKLGFVVAGIVVTIYFQNILSRDASSWEAQGKAAPNGLRVVGVACLVWSFVLIAGRLTAYLGQLYKV